MSWELPEIAEIGGQQYQINTDYRDILEIIQCMTDEKEAEPVRVRIALALFYENFPQMPPEDWQAAMDYLLWFLNCGEKPDSKPAPRLIDWEQDQQMIVADINRVAGCEVRALPFLHWWTFIAWFNGIGEGQLSTVVSIRSKRMRGKKLEKWEQEFYQGHKAMVDLKARYTAEEQVEMERLKKLLGE